MNATPSKPKGTSALPPFLIPLTLVWNVIIALACVALSLTIFNIEDFGGLGDPVKVFVAIAVLIPVVAAVYFSHGILAPTTGKSSYIKPNYRDTRYGLMFFYFLAMVLAIIFLVWQIGVFKGFEALVDGLMLNPWLALVFIGAYVINWIGGRLNENSPMRDVFSRLSLIVGGIALVILLFSAGFLNGIVTLLQTLVSNPPLIIALVATIISGVLMWQYLNRGEHFGESPEQRTAWQGWIMLAPNIVGFMIFFAGPLLLSLYLSFTDDTVGQTPNFIAFGNYAELLSFEFQTQQSTIDPTTNEAKFAPGQTVLSFGFKELGSITLGESRLVIGAKDEQFWISLRNTIVFCLLLMPLAIIPAIFLSLVLNSSLPGMKFYRALYFLPSVAAVVGTAMIWRWLYSPDIGYYNYITTSIITWFNQTFGMSITDPQISWLSDPNVVLISIVLLAAWQVVGYNTVLFLAGLQGIPRDLYEAASIDGANTPQQFFNVTLPMLRPTTFFVIINTMVTGLQVFNEPYALFPSRPMPVQAQTAVFYLYGQGFSEFQFGYASAIAWFLFIIIFSLTYLQFRAQRENA
jgi:ABC-type sugar transport system permease subunit